MSRRTLETQLAAHLEAVGARRQQLSQWVRLTVAWVGVAAVAWGALTLAPAQGLWIAAATLVGAIGTWFLVRTTTPAPSSLEIARGIEARHPELNASLITAVEQAPDIETGRLSLLQESVVREAVYHAESHPWRELVPTWQLAAGTTGGVLAAMLLAITTGTAWNHSQKQDAASLAGSSSNTTDDAPPVQVEPGDVELERGTSLLVLARFQEPIPGRVQLHLTAADQTQQSLPCDKSLDDPVFGARLPSVNGDLVYHVEFDGQSTREYKVTVYDLPALVQSHLELRYPSYTQLEPKSLPSAFEATAVEGTQIEVRCQVNQPLQSATLIGKNGERIALTVQPQNPLAWSTVLSPVGQQQYTLELVGAKDRRNRDPETYRFHMVPNRPPELKLAFPGQDVRVSPLEELSVEGQVADDFGVKEYGVVVAAGSAEPKTLVLGSDLPKATKPFRWFQQLEEWQVQPDDLVTYHLYAVDLGPDGKPRRTLSDMYFAEIRPFEETFREMDAPPGQGPQAGGQQQPAGNQIQQLMELQKQIVTATWNATKSSPEWSSKLADTTAVIQKSQERAKSQLSELLPHLQGPALQKLGAAADERMQAALDDLDKALTESSPSALTSAFAAEQAAYQALLKLKAREHRMMKGQQGGGGGGAAGSPSEQQMNELELSNKENRYESRKAASDPAAATAQQEDLAFLERLKELARRQTDLNDKLKELDAALRQSRSEAEKEEIQRQLKRLREEQQQLLQDSDELRNRMAQSARQEQLSNSREQLENTREKLVEASEALKEGQLSQAINAGNRAEQDLQNLQQEFRQQSAARFAEAMRDLRTEARDLADREKELSEQLARVDAPDQKSLREGRDRKELEEAFRAQQESLKELLDKAREVVKESESAEPLLSQQLYETLRQTRETKVEPALDAVPQLVRQGFLPEAQRAEQIAQQGLDALEQGINKAAESVLGNEVESLKRARRELADLGQQLHEEFGGQNGANPSQEKPAQDSEQTPASDGSQSKPSEDGKPSEQSSQQPGSPSGKPGENSQRGQQAGQQQGNQPGQGNQPSQSPMPGHGNQPGQSPMPGQGNQPGQSPMPGQGGQQGGAPMPDGQEGSGQGEGNPSRQRSRGNLRSGPPSATANNSGGDGRNAGGPGSVEQGGPLTGDRFREWAERLRDVETMVNDPELQAEVAELREQARSLRAEFKRHSVAPNWSLVESSLYEPLVELQQRIAEEVAKHESPESLVPIDRDPVPARYRELVRSYYERLGKGAEK